jgi:adenylate kinase family enzyme
LITFLEKNYRGSLSLEEIIKVLENRDVKSLLPNELILTLVKREIFKREKKTLFIDGFPRNLDQISFALFFRDLIGYRDDPDLFVLIDVPESVIDARIKQRVVCPICQTPRNLRLLPTKFVGYDEKTKQFYLECDNPSCQRAKMVPKEGDELGIEPIRERLRADEEMMEKALSLFGIPKIFLRNAIPIEKALESVDEYEITPEYSYQYDSKEKRVIVTKKPWEIIDDQGVPSFSLLPPPVVVSMIKQMVQALNL